MARTRKARSPPCCASSPSASGNRSRFSVKPGENSMATGASFTLHGAGVAGGIAIGHAHLVSTARLAVAHYEIAPQGIEAEIARFDRAVAHDLSPADMILFKQHRYAGFVTDLGGVTSHTAIVARSLNIPAIVGLHHARGMIREGELVIVDGREGVLIANPGAQVLEEYQRLRSKLDAERQKLKHLRTSRSATMDGVAVELQANIELPQDVAEANEAGAAGIGLFRSAFLFLNRDDLPSEDEQFEAYREVADAMHGRTVTIRTLDLGADKSINGADRGGPNPVLGLRAIRFCLAEPQKFLTQLPAILRASS